MYLALDTEFAGLDVSYSLLTLSFIVADTDFNIVDRLDLKVKPDHRKYVVDPVSMSVNKIDLLKHDEEAISYKAAKTLLYSFLRTNYKKEGLLNAIAHNHQLDYDYIFTYLLSKNSWDQFVKYRVLDTGGLTEFLSDKGKIEAKESSLVYWTKYFGIKVEGIPHTARYDAEVTLRLYEKLKEL